MLTMMSKPNSAAHLCLVI